MNKILNIALVAHDARKDELAEWCTHNAQWLCKHNLFGTGTTAKILSNIRCLNENDEHFYLSVKPLLSGPVGGDQLIGGMIAQGEIDILIFFCDNLITQGHYQDVGALVRLASLYNIPFATNRTTADMIVTSPLTDDENYKPIVPSAIEKYVNRFNL